jgi:hypothetical protein
MNLVKTCPNAAALLMSLPSYIGEQAGAMLGAGPDLAFVVKAVQDARVAGVLTSGIGPQSITPEQAFEIVGIVLHRNLARRASHRAAEAREFLESIDDE